MRIALSTECILLLASLAASTAFSPPSFVAHRNGAAMSRLSAPRHRRVTDAAVATRRDGAGGTRLDMMFDQLSSALTEVAQNFGGKQR